MAVISKVLVVKDNSHQIFDSIKNLVGQEVLVGIPSATASREDDDINNAAIAYVQEFGSPETNLPARPFLIPGVKDVQEQTIETFKKAAVAALAQNMPKALELMNQAGSKAANAARTRILNNIPPPLSPYTVANRFKMRKDKARRPNEEQYLALVAAGTAPGAAQTAANIIALVNTGKMLRAITHVVRKVNAAP